MMELPCLFLLLALIFIAQPVQLMKHENKDKSSTRMTDLVRPRRRIYAIGAGDNYLMTKLGETNARLNTIEGSLFRIENALNDLKVENSHPVLHGASVIKTPSHAEHVSASNGDESVKLPAAPNAGQPQTAGQPASRTAALGQPQTAGHPASRTAAMPGNPSGYPFLPYGGIYPGLQPPQFQPPQFQPPQFQPPQFHPPQFQPPQFQNYMQPQKAQPQPHQRDGPGIIDISMKPKKVSWMDGECSEPCGIANVKKNVTVQKRDAPSVTTIDPIELNQMRVVEKQTQRSRGPRILGGEESTKHKYPWKVYIQIYHAGKTARCGGAIINDRYVITAGHCTYTGNKTCATKLQPEDMSVTVAEHNINSMNDDVGDVTDRIEVFSIIRHPKYCSTNIQMDSDIALLRLKEVLYLPDIVEIGYICLPGSPLDSFSGMTATVAGWGYKDFDYSERNSTDLAVKLHEVDLKIHKDCSGYPEPEDLTDNMFCAGDEENQKDACGGDSGGPLIVQKDGQYILAGIVSFGPEGGDCNGTTIYVKVVNYLQWIRDNTMDAGC